jgi:hypothetical protein
VSRLQTRLFSYAEDFAGERPQLMPARRAWFVGHPGGEADFGGDVNLKLFLAALAGFIDYDLTHPTIVA